MRTFPFNLSPGWDNFNVRSYIAIPPAHTHTLDALNLVTSSPASCFHPFNPLPAHPRLDCHHLKCSTSYSQFLSQSVPPAFWQLEALENVDKWTEPPEGFYEFAVAWQIYFLPTTEGCAGKRRLRCTAQLAKHTSPVLASACPAIQVQRGCWPVIHQYCKLQTAAVSGADSCCGSSLMRCHRLGYCPWEALRLFIQRLI